MQLMQDSSAFVASMKFQEMILYFFIATVLYVGPEAFLCPSELRDLGWLDWQRQFVTVFVYRITFHPLAKYPGPLLQRITDWPLVIHCYRGDRHLWEYKNHQKYGASSESVLEKCMHPGKLIDVQWNRSNRSLWGQQSINQLPNSSPSNSWQ